MTLSNFPNGIQVGGSGFAGAESPSPALQVIGGATIDILTVSTQEISGTLQPAAVIATGLVEGATLTATGAVTGLSGAITDLLTAGTVTSSGAVIGASGSITGLLTGGTISTAGEVIAASGSVTGLLQGGTIEIGTGTAIKGLLVSAVTLSPASVGANTTAEQIFAVTGVLATDVVMAINKPTAQAGLGIVGMRVSSAGNVGITFANVTASPIVPTASESYLIVTLSH